MKKYQMLEMTKKLKTLKILLAIAAVLSLTAQAYAGARIFQNNVMTARHVIAPGSHVGLIPPSGAYLSKEFTGFTVSQQKINIIIRELGTGFEKGVATLAAPALKEQGVTVKDVSDVLLSGKPARLIHATESLKQKGSDTATEVGRWILALGDDRRTVIVNGYYTNGDAAASSLVRRTLLTAVYVPDRPQGAGGDYTITTTGTSFSFAGDFGGTRYFTTDGQPPKDQVTTAVFSSFVQKEKVDLNKRAEHSLSMLKGFLGEGQFTVTSQNAVTISGLKGYEIQATTKGERQGAQRGGRRRFVLREGRVQMAALYDDNGSVYTMLGFAVRDVENYLPQFSRMIRSFKLAD